MIVDQTGDALGTLDQATGITTTHRLNEWDTYSFTLPADDPKIGLLLGADLREAQIWWEDILLVWGPMTRPRVDDDTIVVTGAGAPWYLSVVGMSAKHPGTTSSPTHRLRMGSPGGT